MTLRWTKAARIELEEALQWYEEQLPDLGQDLLRELDTGLRNIERYPRAWHPLGPRVRSYRLNRFPYSVIYAQLDGRPIVLAFAHQHRKPEYWHHRISEK